MLDVSNDHNVSFSTPSKQQKDGVSISHGHGRSSHSTPYCDWRNFLSFIIQMTIVLVLIIIISV